MKSPKPRNYRPSTSIKGSSIPPVISNRDGPAYRLFDAMVNIKETEGDEGYRGAPRILLAILEHLGEISKQKQTD
ncbi:hypothetical protein AD952_14700 [Acetobacter cerevisiae]|uniref:Uncharacterized protein n=1 Tax=Acetobacter cerevisiae TaxID=178900 RepID=A0A149UJS9_9PROT|nr:hypothetical protein AD952_14700 [Acetobacter cerevisiae]